MERLEFIIQAKDKFSNEISGVMKTLQTLPNAALLAGGAIGSVGLALYGIVKSGNEARNELGRMADQLGMTTESFSRMQYAANMCDVAQEDLAQGLKFLERNIGDASLGGEKGKKAFEQIGVSIYDATGKIKDADVIFGEVAEKFSGLENASQKTAIAMDLFGRGGLAMVPMLNEGRAGIEELSKEAEKYGVVLSEKSAQSAEEFEQAQKRMDASVRGLKGFLVTEATPGFAGFFNTLSDNVAENREVIAGWASMTLNVVGTVASGLAYSVAFMVDAVRGWDMMIIMSRQAILQWADAVVRNLSTVAGWAGDFLSAINYRGVFDGMLGGINTFRNGATQASDALTFAYNEAGEALAKATDTKSATARVTEFGEKVRAEAERIKNEGGKSREKGTGQGFGASKKEDLAEEKDFYAELNRLADDYDRMYLGTLGTRAEAVNDWYSEQIEKYRDFEEARAGIDAVYESLMADAREEDIRRQQEHNDRILSQTNDLHEGMRAAWENFALEQGTFIGDISEASIDLFQSLAEGVGQSFADVLVYGEGMTEAFQATLKRVAAMAIKTLVEIGVVRATQYLAAKILGIEETGTRMSQLSMETYAGAFAATACIPIIGPELAPFVAAAAEATMLAGSVVAAAAGKGVGLGVGQAHGGLSDVPEDATYVLKAGERVLAPSQNDDLTAFLDKNAGGAIVIQNLTIRVLDNATDLDTLKSLDKRDWQDLLETTMIPALRELKVRGIYA